MLPRRSWKARFSAMAIKMPRRRTTSMVSWSKVRSVEMDLRSQKGITGLLSMPLARFQITVPLAPSTRCITSRGISCRVRICRRPRLRRVW